MERNPWWVAPLVLTAVLGGGTAYGAWRLTDAAADQRRQTLERRREAAQRAEEQAIVSQINTQMIVESLTPFVWASIPVMVALGGYFIYRSR